MAARGLLVIKTLVFLACLAPFVLLVLRAFEIGGLDLGADPKAEVLKTLGMTGLNLLMLTLCVTPIRRAFSVVSPYSITTSKKWRAAVRAPAPPGRCCRKLLAGQCALRGVNEC